MVDNVIHSGEKLTAEQALNSGRNTAITNAKMRAEANWLNAKALLEAGYSQRKTAQILGVDESTVYRWKKNPPTTDWSGR